MPLIGNAWYSLWTPCCKFLLCGSCVVAFIFQPSSDSGCAAESCWASKARKYPPDHCAANKTWTGRLEDWQFFTQAQCEPGCLYKAPVHTVIAWNCNIQRDWSRHGHVIALRRPSMMLRQDKNWATVSNGLRMSLALSYSNERTGTASINGPFSKCEGQIYQDTWAQLVQNFQELTATIWKHIQSGAASVSSLFCFASLKRIMKSISRQMSNQENDERAKKTSTIASSCNHLSSKNCDTTLVCLVQGIPSP